jgi:leucyl/phenylalanyl-tRNA--protein transferase
VSGSVLLDTQFVTDHLKTFGAVEVPRQAYHKLLEAALVGEADFARLAQSMSGAQALQYAQAANR